MANIRLAAAAESLSNQWIPICPQVQDVIVTKFRKGHYNSDIGLLVTDLTKDLGLFGYCLRTLFGMAKSGEIKSGTCFDIIKLFQQVDLETLGRILAEKPENISMHRLENADENQTSCFHQMLVGTVATETICEKAHFPKSFGFAASFLRQLGLTLIAWNYPHVFRQALINKDSGERFDEALEKLLGYSPRALALAVGYNWGVSPELGYVLGATSALSNVPQQSQAKMTSAAEILCKSCEVGEILARVSHPEMYPHSRGEWNEAKKRIEVALGQKGLNLIQDRVQAACRSYVGEQSSKMAAIASLTVGPSSFAASSFNPVIESSNQEQPMSAQLREKFVKLYASIPNSSMRKDNMLYWAQELVPAAGFSGGCIFMFDFDRSELIPRYRFGSSNISSQAASYSILDQGDHPAVAAFKSTSPVLEINSWTQDESAGHIAQTFGVIQRVGVIYLEIGKPLANSGPEAVTLMFHKVRQAVQECLGVK